MSISLESISSGKVNRPPRIILLGVEKIGKSTFASCSEKPIFIPIKGEEGIDALDVPKFPVCNTLQDMMECLYCLYKDKHDYCTVVIDSASALEPLVWGDVCKRNGNVDSIEKACGGYGKGYGEAANVWRLISDSLDHLRSERGMASMIIGHVKVKRFDDPAGPSYDQYQFDINEKASALLYRWSDVILFCNKKVVVRSEDVGFNKEKHQGMDIASGASFLYTQKRPAHPGGGRGIYGQLPYEIPLSWKSFMEAANSVAS
jgi:hypothetical protein